MGPSRRRLLLLLLPAILLTVLWVRSAYVGDVWSRSTRFTEWGLRSDWGRLSITVISGRGVDPRPLEWERIPGGGMHGDWPGPPVLRQDLLLGQFRTGGVFLSSTDTYWGLELYHPVLIVLLALPVVVPAAVALARRRRVRRRIGAGLCVRCGYDVRGTPGRCPECGSSFPVNSTIPAA